MRCAEEAIELAQAENVTSGQVHDLVDRVFSRPVGNPVQEGAGLAVCLLAWSTSYSILPDELAQIELERIEKIDREVIRRKQAEKAQLDLGLYPEEES